MRTLGATVPFSALTEKDRSDLEAGLGRQRARISNRTETLAELFDYVSGAWIVSRCRVW
jgi:hypothetical protein